MKPLRALRIRTKIVLIITATSVLSLLLAASVIYFRSRVEYRDELTTALISNARLIAYNSTAAIDFDNPEEAEAGLDALKIHENIVGASISTKPGEIFAAYLRDGAPENLFDNLRFVRGNSFANDMVFVTEDHSCPKQVSANLD